MTIIYIRGTSDKWNQAVTPHAGDVIVKDGEEFRVLQRKWVHDILHCEVVPIVEREDDEPQVPSEASDG